MTLMHAFTGNLPAAVQQIAAAPGETLPVPVASAGREGSVRPVPVRGHPHFTSLEHVVPGGRSGARVNEEDRIFSVTKNCTSCGTCTAVCPVGNIEMMGKKPAWKNHCELCLACIRTCPAQAIRVGSRKAGRPQYRHTGITPADRERQRGK
jgi:ferredoxin